MIIKVKKKKENNKKLLIALLSVCSVLVVLFSALLGMRLAEYKKGADVYKEISEKVATTPETDDGLSIDFDALLAINEDVVGWLYCEGTKINYPLVKGENNSEYLYRLIDGESSKLGTLYLDYRNDARFSDTNTVIYGHNLGSGDMFADVVKFKEQAFYDEHPTMILYTPSGNYTIELVAGFTKDVSNYWDFDLNMTTSERDAFMQEAFDASTFESGVELANKERLITLCTCNTNTVNDYRYMLIGRLVPIYG